MCGIVGYVGKRPVVDILIRGLRALEYRGYDSAGIAIFKDRKIEIRKSEGRLENVEKLLREKINFFSDSTCGIGHTRWATHGKPTSQNAHPHKTGHIVLVHNGIIENYIEIKRELMSRGHLPLSETDSELFGFLVLEEMEKGFNLVDSVRKSFLQLKGQSSVVVISEREPGVIVGVRNGSPLVVALDPEGGVILASDAQPLIPYNSEVIFLEHGDLIIGTAEGLKIFDLETGSAVVRPVVRLDWTLEKLDKGRFPHYMLKEIFEQPEVLVETLNGILDRTQSQPYAFSEQPGVKILDQAIEFIFVACGTSWHAALLGKYWIERRAQVSVSVELASEFRYCQPVLRPGVVVVGISQSGETADTLAVLREMRRKGISTLGISNVRGSSISREADAVFYTFAGPEIGVAATKTFTAQMLVLYLISGYLSNQRKVKNLDASSETFAGVIKLPQLLSESLQPNSKMMKQIYNTAMSLTKVRGFFFIGRGYSFPMALEGALKLKEIAYEYAEGYAAGELKHGPIAMIDKGMVVIVLAPRDSWRDKTVSNLEEVKARGAIIVGVGDSDDEDLKMLCDYWIPIAAENRSIDSDLLPFFLAPVVQLLSYYRAVLKGTDVDKPRNLAKSVTVE